MKDEFNVTHYFPQIVIPLIKIDWLCQFIRCWGMIPLGSHWETLIVQHKTPEEWEKIEEDKENEG